MFEESEILCSLEGVKGNDLADAVHQVLSTHALIIDHFESYLNLPQS